MPSRTNEIVHDFSPFIRVYKDGRLERLVGNDLVPASIDPETGVQSKDVVIAPESSVSARLYIPKTTNPNHKLPLVVYFHGGGFVIGSAFSLTYHRHLNLLAAEANVAIVSVDYRLAPEHPLPTAHDDSWIAVKWVASHSKQGGGHEPWLKDRVDFERVFFAGDSAGANIAHDLAIRVGSEKLDGVKLGGIVLNHPYFGGKEPIGDEAASIHMKAYFDQIWLFAYPSTKGFDDPLYNPAVNPKLPSLGCSRVLVCVAEEDELKYRGWYYYEVLGKINGWRGKVEIMETKGEGHVFYLFNPSGDNAVALLKKMASFINQDKA